MTIPKWLLPVFAIVAALAVGVAATLIGLRFQPQESIAISPETITAPVLAPLTPVDENDPDSGYVWGLSDTVGTLDVNAPGTVLPDDLDLEEALDRYAGSSDPGAELEAIVEEAEAEAPAPVGDSCAPEDGELPAGCPPGAMGRIFALVAPPELEVTGQAYPPTEAQYAARGNPTGPLWCLPPVGLGENDVPFGILSTVPASFTVLYWPEGSESARLSVTAGGPANAAAWEAALASATDAADLPPLQSCLVLPDLEPDTAYRAQILATTPTGVLRMSGAIPFNSGGAPARPAAEFHTLGQNYVFARALHTEEQRVEFRAFITNPAEGLFGGGSGPLTTCPTGSSSLSPIAGGIREIPADEVIELNAPSDYNQRTGSVFRVPEGADVMFCARWYPVEADMVSWERNQPLWETMTSFSAPDRVLPILTLDAGGPLPDIGRDIQLTVSTTEGVVCGITDLLVDGFVPRDNPVLCDPSVLATASARERDRRYWSQEFRGDLVLTTVLTKNDGSTEENTTLIPASRRNCFGSCELPRPEVFGLPVGQPEYDCGSDNPFELNRGACRPIEGTEEFELAVDLTWTQGLTNGRTTWSQSEVVDGAVSDLFEFSPQMNTDERFEFTVIDPVTLTGSAELRLETDRPVEYTVYVRNADGSGACQVNPFGPVSGAISGTSSGETIVTVNHLCRGRIYVAEVFLRDPATGTTSLWRADALPNRWPGGRSAFVIPGQRIENLNYSWSFSEAPPELEWTTVKFDGGRVAGRFANSGEPCLSASDAFSGTGVADAILGTTTRFQLEFEGARTLDLSGLCVVADRSAYFNVPLDVDLYTIMTTGEQNFRLHPFAGTTVDVRVWIG